MERENKTMVWIGGVFTVIVILAVFMASATDQSANAHLCSSLNSQPRGVKAFYTLLKEYGYPVSRWEWPLPAIRKKYTNPVLFISVAPVIAYRAADADTLQDYVRNGSTAFIFYSPSVDTILQKLKIKISKTSRDSLLHPCQLAGGTVFGDTLYNGVSDTNPAFQNTTRSMDSDTTIFIGLYGKACQQAVISVPYGAGEFILCSSPAYIMNQHVVKYGNVNNLIRLIDLTPGGQKREFQTILFDEYHQGYQQYESVVSVLDELPIKLGLLLSMAGLLMWIYSRAARFGRPVPVRKITRRSSAAYIQSVTQVYRKARANRWVLKIWYHWVRRYLAARFRTNLDYKLVNNLNNLYNMDAEKLQRFFNDVERRIQGPGKVVDAVIRERYVELSDEELLRWIQYLDFIYRTRHHHKHKNHKV